MQILYLLFFFTVNTSDEPLKKKPRRSSDLVYEIAPGERKKLTNWTREKHHDRKAFPELFPDGNCGLHDQNRKRKITATQNFNHKVLNINRKFAEDPDFVFVAQQYLEWHSFENQIAVSLQRGTRPYGGNEIQTNNAIDVFKAIPGTPSYWKKFRNEIFARMEQLGGFHFFFTLSSAESKQKLWPEVERSILHSLGNVITYEPGWEKDESKVMIDGVPLPKYREENINRKKSKFYKNQFLLITRIFDNKAKAFVKLLTANGDVTHYSYRIEFQIRGMPHVHGIFWLSEDLVKPYKNDNNEFNDLETPELIDKWISVSLDTGDEELDQLVREVNMHKHTDSCQKLRSKCRFNFPRLPSNKTIIAGPLPSDMSEEDRDKELAEAKDTLEFVKDQLSEITDEEIDERFENNLEIFLKKIDIDIKKYEKALRISQRGKIVIMKRTLKERNVNNYNKEWMKAWRGNLDIQFCYDSYAVVTYITDYFSKPDAGMTAVLKKALEDTKGYCNDFDRLNYIKREFFTHRQCSVAEATYRLIPGMNLKGSNVKNTFVGTGFPENRSNFYTKVMDNEDQIHDSDYESDNYSEGEDEDRQIEYETITIPGRKGRFRTAVTVHKKYANRPIELETVCLAQFATSYESSKKPGEKVSFNDDGVSHQKGLIKQFGTDKMLPKYIELNRGGFMRLRVSPSILRIHSSKKKKGNEGFYAELLLYCPWRNESNDLKPPIDKFNENFELVKENKKAIYPNSDMIDVMRDMIQNPSDARPLHLMNMDAAGEQENIDDEAILESLDTTELPEPEERYPENVKSGGCLFKPIIVDELEVMLHYARSLSFEQRIVFDRIMKFCKQVLRWKQGAPIPIKPPQLIVKGNSE